MFDDRLKRYVIRVGKIAPITTVLIGDIPVAIAQNTQQTQPVTYAQPTADPISSWGILAALIVSTGTIVATGIRGFLGNLSKRSEIELKAQDLQNQRSETTANTMLEQWKSLVEGLKEERKIDREERKEDRKQLIDVINNTNATLNRLTAVVEELQKK